MKKLLVTLTAVLVSVSTFGQGTLIFNNRTGNVDAPVRRPDGTGAGAGITAALYLVNNGVVGAQLTPTTTFRTTSAAAAFYVNQVTVAVPGVAPGGAATVRMRAWEGGSWDASLLRGESNDVTLSSLGGVPAGGGAPITDPILTGLTAFNLVAVPEPSTMALGLLGAAALLYRRRK